MISSPDQNFTELVAAKINAFTNLKRGSVCRVQLLIPYWMNVNDILTQKNKKGF